MCGVAFVLLGKEKRVVKKNRKSRERNCNPLFCNYEDNSFLDSISCDTLCAERNRK